MAKTQVDLIMKQQSLSPLSLIAVFAGVIEASALASLPFLSESSQGIYTWFLVGFPFFLTVLFFLTLNFNNGTLFAPRSQDDTAEQAPAPQDAAPAAPAAPPAASEPPPLATALFTPVATDSTPMIIALSGPQSRANLQRHFHDVLERKYSAPRSWTLHDLDNRITVQLTVGPMADEAMP